MNTYWITLRHHCDPTLIREGMYEAYSMDAAITQAKLAQDSYTDWVFVSGKQIGPTNSASLRA